MSGRIMDVDGRVAGIARGPDEAIYWIDCDRNEVRVSNGSEIRKVATLNSTTARTLAIDPVDLNVYWSDLHSIHRFSLASPTNTATLVQVSESEFIPDFSLGTNRKLYWTVGRDFFSADADGKGVNRLFQSTTGRPENLSILLE